MRFYDDPEQLVRVRYYFVPKGTPFVPYPTPFVSSNWDYDQIGYSGPGEVWPPQRTWASGAKIGDASPVAGRVCGTAEQWHNGCGEPPEVPIPTDSFGTPLCCNRLTVPFQHGNCGVLKSAWSQYSLTMTGGGPPGPYTPAQGTWVMRYAGGCSWRSDLFIVTIGIPYQSRWVMQVRAGPRVDIFIDLQGGPAGPLYRLAVDWEGNAPLIVPYLPPPDLAGGLSTPIILTPPV